jgi:hypothetical protein
VVPAAGSPAVELGPAAGEEVDGVVDCDPAEGDKVDGGIVEAVPDGGETGVIGGGTKPSGAGDPVAPGAAPASPFFAVSVGLPPGTVTGTLADVPAVGTEPEAGLVSGKEMVLSGVEGSEGH